MGWPTCRYPRYKYPLVSFAICSSTTIARGGSTCRWQIYKYPLVSTSTSTLCSVLLLTIHTDLEVQAENERENLEEDNACLAEVVSEGVSSQIILYLPLKWQPSLFYPIKHFRELLITPDHPNWNWEQNAISIPSIYMVGGNQNYYK